MDLSYCVLRNAVSDRIPEGFIERVRAKSIVGKHKVEWSGAGTVMALLPVLERVSPETPKFRGVGCNFEPVVANEDEIVRALLQPFEAMLPNEALDEYLSEDFGRYAGGNVQQRI